MARERVSGAGGWHVKSYRGHALLGVMAQVQGKREVGTFPTRSVMAVEHLIISLFFTPIELGVKCWL